MKTSEQTFDEFEELVLELDMARILFAEEEEEEEEEARIVVSIKDITDRKRTEEALSAKQVQLQAILDYSPALISIKDLNGNVILANRNFTVLDAPPLYEFVGKNVFDLFPKEVAYNLWNNDQLALKAGGPVESEEIVKHKDGSWHTYLTVKFPVYKEPGQPFGICAISTDITERKLTEQAQLRLVAMLDATPGFVGFADAKDTHILYINPAGRKIVGVQAQEDVTQLKIADVHPEWTNRLFRDEIFPTAIRDGLWTGECAFLNRDGDETSVMMALLSHKSPSGEVERFSTVSIDITELKRAEEALKEALEVKQTVLDHINYAVSVIDPTDFTIVSANKTFLDIYKMAEKQAIGKHCYEITHQRSNPCNSPDDICPLLETLKTGKTVSAEHIHFDGWGGKSFCKIITSPMRNEKGEIYRVVHLIEDITERKKGEAALQDSREQMRALAGRLQAVREEERTQIAREIHDELGGALTGLKIDFSLLTRAALKIEKETVRTSLLAGMNSMTKFIDATIHTVRRIAMELRPGILDDLGLVAALEWQLKDFEKRTGIRCEFFPPGEDISLNADLSTALFRIFQEALTNVARHSGATEVRVRLRADADSPVLAVENNGKSIEKEKILSKESLGLLGMRERAQMFGGRITVTGTPGTGTTVTVEIPPVEKRKMDRDQEGAAG
jgi:PAS domain S-box-containing protein